MEYTEAYRKLQTGVCVVTFIKKDATVRNMLATRNKRIVSNFSRLDDSSFNGHDRRCSIDNGNIAVYDLIIDEVRMFNIGRVVGFYEFGDITSQEEMNNAVEQFKNFDTKYRENSPMELHLDMKMGDTE